jgi:hypothetical protein
MGIVLKSAFPTNVEKYHRQQTPMSANYGLLFCARNKLEATEHAVLKEISGRVPTCEALNREYFERRNFAN